MGFLKNYKFLLFAGGFVTALAGKKFIKSKTARKLAVEGMAAGMKLQKDALETFHNIKEEATDMLHDAAEKEESAK